ncbi:MAG: peptidase S10 [Gammaproteobacteria bacterium]|nr:peptidase S10 [Gammaproteobacteria bacterium]
MKKSIHLLAILLAMPLLAVHAAESESDNGGVQERQVTTEHSVRINGDSIDYTATTGTLVLRDSDGGPKASFFYIAYTRDDIRNRNQRPVTFTFNGGPGSSSVWLHLGTFGPKRVVFDDAEQPEPAPYRLSDNEESLLDVTDLVFIDPVGTGFSRAEGDTDAKEFYGVEEDRKAVADFIRLWTARNNRWNSPKFLAGESYGTTRAAAVVTELQQRGMFMNGVILVSSILNFQTARFETGNDLPYVMFLPTYAATAWYHGKVEGYDDNLEGFLAEARAFAASEYTLALMQGDTLADSRRQAVAEKLAKFTGLDEEFLLQANLRPSIFRFVKELLRDERRTVGRLDSRYTGIDSDAAGEGFEHDPSYTAITGPYTAAMNSYLRNELGYEEDREYEILSFTVNRNWNWDTGRAGYVNVAEDLRRAMSTNTHLEVFVANGYYDLATPFYATEYTMDHLGLEPELRDNIEMAYYPAGHMMYIHPPSLEKLNDDIRSYITSTLQ